MGKQFYFFLEELNIGEEMEPSSFRRMRQPSTVHHPRSSNRLDTVHLADLLTVYPHRYSFERGFLKHLTSSHTTVGQFASPSVPPIYRKVL